MSGLKDPFWAVVARKKAGGNEAWQWASCEAVGPDFLVAGGVPKVVTRGKNKGRNTWRGIPLERFVVARGECEAAEAEYSASTGNCPSCRGAGKEAFRWTREEGTSYRACRPCSGTGKATALSSAAPMEGER